MAGSPFDGAVLTGGASHRMGRDKALIEVDGRPLVQAAADALIAGGASEVVLIGGDAVALAPSGLYIVADRWPGEGPLGGVITALDRPGHDVVVILACDQPGAAGLAVASVAGALGRADVAVPNVGGRRQWMHAAWRRNAVGPLLAAFEAGERSLHRAVSSLEMTEVLDGDPGWYADVDRPDDLMNWD